MGRKPVRHLTNNEIFTENISKEISKLFNISEEVVDSILLATALHVLRDAKNQSEENDTIMLKIPKICDIELLRISDRRRVRTENVYFEESFRSKLKESLYTDQDYLDDYVLEGVKQLVTDKFINAVKDIEKEDLYG